MSQIIAGSLAAVTSFLLSAKIGIAGSVIGAAASYVISTLAANIYGTILKASGQKLQEVNPLSNTGSDDDAKGEDSEKSGESESEKADDAAHADAGKTGDGAAATDETDDGEETVIGRFNGADVLAAGAAGAKTRRLGIGDVPLPPAASAASKDRIGRVAGSNGLGAPSPNTSTYNVSELRGKRRIDPKRMAIIVSVVSGLLGVAITAGVVMLITNGNGTDTVVRDIVSPSSTSKTTTDTGTTTQETPTKPDKPTDQNGYGTTDDTTDGTTDGTDTGTTSGSTGTDSSTGTSGSGTSGSTGSSSGSSSSGSSSSGSTGSGTTGSESGSSSSGSSSSGSTGGESTGSSSSGSTGSGSTSSGSTGGESTGTTN
ncbi:hypothetical protein [Bifidobacterium parmae]|uniref:Uncharacterized protein n=1 Tax=Bifidobacterium parmae TaxID=361854 RepID=A0A2N5J5C3_9BIFI|nr:hypothetical protein [Bifidobacterium parmae]PLS29421.1 hypothetical protein Uis4E_0295 [Bifidobacterium parmae]